MSNVVLDEKARRYLREAAEWHLLAMLFARPAEGWSERVCLVGKQVDRVELRELARRASTEAEEGAYLAVLGPGGVASPRAAGWCGAADPARLLADLRAAYHAFAYENRADEPPDHVTVMADFVAFLLLKEAYARSREDVEQARMSAEGAAWVRPRVATVAHALAARLERASAAAYLAEAAQALAHRAGPAPSGADAASELTTSVISFAPEKADGHSFFSLPPDETEGHACCDNQE